MEFSFMGLIVSNIFFFLNFVLQLYEYYMDVVALNTNKETLLLLLTTELTKIAKTLIRKFILFLTILIPMILLTIVQ